MNMNFGGEGERERERKPFPDACREGGDIFVTRKHKFTGLPLLLSQPLYESAIEGSSFKQCRCQQAPHPKKQ